jgi:hypothetical protein
MTLAAGQKDSMNAARIDVILNFDKGLAEGAP